MPLRISDICNNCGLCEIYCPYEAIYPRNYNWRRLEPKYLSFCEDNSLRDDFISEDHFYIVPYKCTECRGIYDVPRCMQICPLSAVVFDENHIIEDRKAAEIKKSLDRYHPWRNWE
jgi:ferredoxin